MIKSARRRRLWTRPLGFVIGAGAVLAFLSGAKVPGGNEKPGAQVTMVARSLGEFRVKPVLPFLVTSTLYPGSPTETGQVSLSNISPKPHTVHIKPSYTNRDLESFLLIKVIDGSSVIFEGTLKALKNETPAFHMDIGQQKELKFSVKLPILLEDNSIGRAVDIEIDFVIDQIEVQKS